MKQINYEDITIEMVQALYKTNYITEIIFDADSKTANIKEDEYLVLEEALNKVVKSVQLMADAICEMGKKIFNACKSVFQNLDVILNKKITKNERSAIMYEKCEIESMLKEYLKSKSQLEELESKIAKNKVTLKYNGMKMQESEEEAIEGMSLNSPTISDMPRGKTNKINRPTEDIALTYKEKLTYINKADKIKLMNENYTYNEKAEPLRDLVGKVDRMLKALNNEQKLIIKTYYMYEPKWNYVATTYVQVYNEPRTVNQLKNIRDKALEIMLEVINI